MHRPRGRGNGGGGGRGRGGRAGNFNSSPTDARNALNGESGEVNAHLAERFKGKRPSRLADADSSLTGPPIRLQVNKDVRKYVHAQEDVVRDAPDGDWTGRPEFPSNEEITLPECFQVEITPNKKKGKWKTTDRYLRAHYGLLREDAVSPLRDAVDSYKKNPSMMDDGTVFVYDKVYISGFTFSWLGIAARIRFKTRAEKNIVWSASKRLTSGTLVALFPADDKLHQKCVVALVAARPFGGLIINPLEIDIFFSNPQDIEIDPQQEWVMIEARSGYFEAYRHTLRALQKLSKEKFPLSKHICTMSPDIEPPVYLKDQPVMDLGPATAPDQPDGYGQVDVIGDWPSATQSSLDDSQWDALNQILTKSLSIIQGPPGTGKTHVSKVAIDILRSTLSEDQPPIIIAAQTNHALDQLLVQVSEFESRYIRLGGRSTNSEVKKHALFEVRKAERFRLPGGLIGSSSNNHNIQSKAMINLLKPLDSTAPLSVEALLENKIISQKQATSLGTGAARWVSADGAESDPMGLWLGRAVVAFRPVWEEAPNFGTDEEDEDLEIEQLSEQEAESGVTDEEDWELLKGPWCRLNESWTVKSLPESDLEPAAKELDKQQDLWKVRESLRGPMYQLMQQRLKAALLVEFRKQAVVYEKNLKDLKVGRWELDAEYLRRVKVIGMTTTGLSKYRPLIASLKPKIVLIEEAAEVLEAPVTVACMESLEHLILVGDHLQLQGHCNIKELEGEPYYLNISMFERLVSNGIPFKSLLRQRRMDPSFRKLISGLYPDLSDHESVINRASREYGMGVIKSFFLAHEWYESRDSNGSTYNEEEAKFIAAFYRYVHQQGVPVEMITVLTFYNAQRKKILRELRAFPELKEEYNKVKTVDSYQGEENEIVILSLTRSTHDGKIGFLQNENRACVALSRAKVGFFIFGNRNTLLQSRNELWNHVITQMKATKRYHNALPLYCKAHNKTTLVKYPDEWNEIDGGCMEKCISQLPCGHACPLNCHPFDHHKVMCNHNCHRQLVCGHECTKRCAEPCECNCHAFKEAQWAIEGKNTATEAADFDPSSYQKPKPPAVDIRYRGPPDPAVIPDAAWGNPSAPTNNGWGTEQAWGTEETWGQENGYGHGNNPQNSRSAIYLPVQNQPRYLTNVNSETPMRRIGRYMMPHGRGHILNDRFAETTENCMRFSAEEQEGKKAGWTSFANTGVEKDDERRNMTCEGESSRPKVAEEDVQLNLRAIEESARAAGGGRTRFQDAHVPAAWEAHKNDKKNEE